MARSDTRYSIYPATKAVEVVGNSAPALNQAIECWAALIARATADNAKTIWNSIASFEIPDFEAHYALKEWCVLADILKGKTFDPDFANPCELLATIVEDSHRLEGVGAKWFSMELPTEEYSEVELSDKRVAELAKKLRALDYSHAWAVILAVQWFWEHQNADIVMEKDLWWTLAFRRQWHQKLTAKTPPRTRRKHAS